MTAMFISSGDNSSLGFFGTAGYRALASKDSLNNVLLIVKSLCDRLTAKGETGSSILVGYDTRIFNITIGEQRRCLSSRDLALIIAKLISDSGLTPIVTQEPTPSPVLSWAAFRQEKLNLKINAIVNITASHNSLDFVGIKLNNSRGEPECDEVYDELQRIIDTKYFDSIHERIDPLIEKKLIEYYTLDEHFSPHTINLREAYIVDLKGQFNFESIKQTNLKIAVDYSFGSAAGYFEQITSDTNINIIPLNNASPANQNINPDTEEENLMPLMTLVEKERCDFGICLDTDGNKIAVVDENGSYVNTDTIIAMITEYLLKAKKETGTIILTYPTSRLVEKIAITNGIPKEKIIYTDVGFKYIAQAMNKYPDYLIAAEEFGGATVKGWIRDSDSFYLVISILNIISRDQIAISKSITKLSNAYGYYYKERFSISPSDIQKTAERISNFLNAPLSICNVKEAGITNEKILRLIIRKSGTDNKFRIYIETRNVSIFSHLHDIILNQNAHIVDTISSMTRERNGFFSYVR